MQTRIWSSVLLLLLLLSSILVAMTEVDHFGPNPLQILFTRLSKQTSFTSQETVRCTTVSLFLIQYIIRWDGSVKLWPL